MAGTGRRQLSGLLAEHHLQLGRLDRKPQRILLLGLTMSAAGVILLLVAYLAGSPMTAKVCSRGTATQVTALVQGGLTVVVLATGLCLLGLAGLTAAPRLARTRFVLLLAVPAVLLPTAMTNFGVFAVGRAEWSPPISGWFRCSPPGS